MMMPHPEQAIAYKVRGVKGRIVIRTRDTMRGPAYDAAIFTGDRQRLPTLIATNLRASQARGDFSDGHELVATLLSFMGSKEAIRDCYAPRWVVEAPHMPGCLPDDPDGACYFMNRRNAEAYARDLHDRACRCHGRDATGSTWVEKSGMYRFNVTKESIEVAEDDVSDVVNMADRIFVEEYDRKVYGLTARTAEWGW